jgi:hypothetical protein
MLSLDDVGKGNEAQPADINRRIEGRKIGGVVAVAIGKRSKLIGPQVE